jgi:PAS domain S-box-containing protein
MGKVCGAAVITRKMISLSVALGVFVWLADSLWDAHVGNKGSFAMLFFSPGPPEITVRFLTAFIFIGFGMYGSALFEQTRRSEEQRRESEARYHDLFENANDLIQSVSPDGRFLYVNRAWRQTLGYSAGDVQGLTVFDIIHPDWLPHCRSTFQRIMAGESIDSVEAVFITRDRKPVMVQGSVNCSMADGRPVATRGIFRNVTEHRLAEEFIKNILESVDEGFIIIGTDFRIMSANKAYCRKLKVPPPDVIGRHCYAVSHHSAQPCYENGEECAVKRTFETGEPFAAIHQHYDSDGKPIYIEIKSFPLKDPLGKIVSAIEIHNDITEKRALEEQLRHAQKMEAVGTLAGGVAHDFNNILTAITGYGSLLQMKIPRDNALRPHVDNILFATERAANLTQSLLAFSRKQVMSLKFVDLETILRRVEKLLERLIGEDIEVTIACRENATVRADVGQVEQVLVNLATNARDAMPRGGNLLIECGIAHLGLDFIRNHGYGKQGAYGLISITDTGHGMDRKTAGRIFEPFFTTKEVGKGTGLGLAIVYGIVKQHGGYITVYSEPGQGTVFKLYVPLQQAAAEASGLRGEGELPRTGTGTVLIAEDDDAVRVLSRRVLEGFGYTVIEAADGEEAVERCREQDGTIDLLILDVIMPRMNGKEVYDAVRASNPDIKVLFMSGYTREIIRRRGMLDEGVHFLSKPVSPRELLNKVDEILKRE